MNIEEDKLISMNALYEQNIAKFSSKAPKDKLVGSKRTHEDSDDSSISGGQSKEDVTQRKKFNLTNSKTKPIKKLSNNYASSSDVL